MATIRVQKNKENPYVVLNKTALEDNNLSFKAKGIFAYLMAKPDDWKCKVEDLQNHSTDGRDSVRNGLRELREHGYMIKRPIRNELGKIEEWEEILFEVPQIEAKKIFKNQEVKRLSKLDKKQCSSINGFSVNGKAVNGKAVNGKPVDIINNDLINKEKLNNNILNNNNKEEEVVVSREEINLVRTYLETYLKRKLNLTDEDVRSIAIAFKNKFKNLNSEKFKELIHIANETKNIKNFVGWILKAIENDYKQNDSNKELKFNNFEQRTYDYDKLERQLLGWDEDK